MATYKHSFVCMSCGEPSEIETESPVDSRSAMNKFCSDECEKEAIQRRNQG